MLNDNITSTDIVCRPHARTMPHARRAAYCTEDYATWPAAFGIYRGCKQLFAPRGWRPPDLASFMNVRMCALLTHDVPAILREQTRS